jgi:Ca-activated chloride channel family protein
VTWLEEHFENAWLLVLLGLLPALVLVSMVVGRRRRTAACAVAGPRAPDDRFNGWQRLGSVCSFVGVALMLVGAAGPRWGRDPALAVAPGRDILIVLDISRSMLAEDRPPRSRLTRAKTEVLALVAQLQRRGGHRLGLIGFAGQARVLCPLTEDFDHFRFALDLAHPDRLGPGERIGYGEGGSGYGTSLRHALEFAVATHDPAAQGFQEILLVSDGDDLAGDWQEALPRVREAGTAVVVLGIGDPDKDAFIPTGRVNEPFLLTDTEDARRKVTTRRRDDVLKTIADQTGGSFLVEGQSFDTWFQEQIAPRPVQERTQDRRLVAVHRYVWFFAPASGLLLIELVLSYGWRRRNQ